MKTTEQAARQMVEHYLGYSLTDPGELPDGIPADLTLAIETVSQKLERGHTDAFTDGIMSILNNYRRYTFALPD